MARVGKVIVVPDLRVYSISLSLPDRARALLAESSASYQVFDDLSRFSRDCGEDVVDVVHVPLAGHLDIERSAKLIGVSPARRFGILSEEAGLVVHRAGKDALRLYYRPVTAQADERVYVTGAEHRIRYGADRDVPAPRQVYLGLTQRCNRSCTFCVSRSFDFDLLSVLEVERLCAELAGSVDVVALTGAGEAMTHPRFWEIMDLLCERLPGVQFKMNTSGIALTRKASRLLQYPVKNITVSLNAATESTYERFVGPGFPAALKGVAALVGARAAARREDLRICLSMVLMRSTVGETAALARIAAELGVEEIQGIYLMINDDVLAAESLWHEPEHANTVLAAAARQAAALGVLASLPPPFNAGETCTDRAQLTSLPTTQGQRCTEAWSTVYVRPNGEIMACPYMDRAMGDTRGQTLAEVWNGQPYRELRRGLVSQDYCSECQHCCGFNEAGLADEYWSHWLGERRPQRPLPLTVA
jgi:MoaA/NifB/PqqE/SkfB family radical SAM enzyme